MYPFYTCIMKIKLFIKQMRKKYKSSMFFIFFKESVSLTSKINFIMRQGLAAIFLLAITANALPALQDEGKSLVNQRKSPGGDFDREFNFVAAVNNAVDVHTGAYVNGSDMSREFNFVAVGDNAVDVRTGTYVNQITENPPTVNSENKSIKRHTWCVF